MNWLIVFILALCCSCNNKGDGIYADAITFSHEAQSKCGIPAPDILFSVQADSTNAKDTLILRLENRDVLLKRQGPKPPASATTVHYGYREKELALNLDVLQKLNPDILAITKAPLYTTKNEFVDTLFVTKHTKILYLLDGKYVKATDSIAMHKTIEFTIIEQIVK